MRRSSIDIHILPSAKTYFLYCAHRASNQIKIRNIRCRELILFSLNSPWRPPEWRGGSLCLGSEHELSALDLELDLGGGPGHGQLARGGGGPV